MKKLSKIASDYFEYAFFFIGIGCLILTYKINKIFNIADNVSYQLYEGIFTISPCLKNFHKSNNGVVVANEELAINKPRTTIPKSFFIYFLIFFWQ